jgi:hypothetical protein
MPIQIDMKAVIVEDSHADAEQIEKDLNEIDVRRIVRLRSYEDANLIELAKDADIVSLDTGAGGYSYQSLAVARALAKVIPYAANFFYTADPLWVIKNPFNFIIEKHKPAQRAFGHVVLMMLAHNRSLSVLHSLSELLRAKNEDEINERLRSVNQDIKYFHLSLSSIVNRLSKADPDTASRYDKLKSIIHDAATSQEIEKDASNTFLTSVSRPLLYSVRDELAHLRDIEGVHVEPEAESEINLLESRLLAARATRTLRQFSEKRLWMPDVLLTKGDLDVPDEPVEHEVESGDPASTIYLNVWFYDVTGETVTLVEQEPMTLAVNIGPLRQADSEYASSDAISADTSHLFYSIEYLDILIICPDASVEPLNQRLPMPPGPNATVIFTLTPNHPGSVEVTVVILVCNDPIHRSVFSFEAVEAAQTIDAV